MCKVTPIDLDAASAESSDNSLPDYESDVAFGETQEDGSVAESEYADADAETEVETHAHCSSHADEIESDDIERENYNEETTEVASRLCDSEDEIEAENDGDSECDDGREAEADASEDVDDPEADVDDSEVDEDDDDRESTSHITDLVLVDTEDKDTHEKSDYDCLFDPSDESEIGHGEIALAEDVVIGRRRTREEDGKPAREPKRAKVDSKRVKRDTPPSLRPGLREAHERRKPTRFEDYEVYSAFKALHTDRRGSNGIRRSDVKIPRTRREALRSKYAPFWEAAMDKQVGALRAKGVLKTIPRNQLPEGQKLLKTMWVFDAKTDHLGYIVEFRARIVGRGDKQRPGLDYQETFSPVARMATFRLFVALSKLLELPIYQGDINTAYLNALLTIKQYLEDLDGYPCDEEGMVYMINKALYGLKQSGREWNTEVNAWFLRYGFKQCSTEPCLYFYERDGVFAIVLLYVDDILCATKDEQFKKKMFEQLNEDYGIKDQGLLSTYLGVEVEQNEQSIKVHQTLYCEQILEKFGFSDAHPSRIPMETTLRLTVTDTDTASRKQELPNGKTFPYRELVGSLMYLATCTRPDLAYAVGQLSRYVQCPTQQHIGAAKRVLRYLVGMKSQGIVYTRDKSIEEMNNTLLIDGYCDSDWGNNPDTRKSITGYVHCMAGGAVSWASRRQSIVAQSTAEAEYVAACEACMEAQGLRNVLIEVFPEMTTKLRQGIDNQAAFVMATNPTYSRRTRHIELRWHYVRDQVAKKTVELWKVKTDDNPSDLMTKPLASDRFEMLNQMIGMTKDQIPKEVTSEGVC
ncbi:hypothetical protein PF011_g22184 [Phytophthora fragariae]|uniref:Reverse transcriptase Ty1/copia-type domain-containing protein n=1 Tax=Phytophthora fragariae TaxID=53985 RepID=A0A6A3IDE1_9STRA|nr:hypothetical protein PF011_g22184 [Phytophthora fragariae]